MLPPAPPPRPAPLGPATTARQPARAALHILVVDDEAAVRQVATDILAQHGSTTTVAEDGLRALELLGGDELRVHAVLLDYSMPRLDGLETFKRLRERRRDLPVVLMSGFDREVALERFAGLGITGFLQKPFSPADLLAAVATAAGTTAPPS